MYEFQSLKRDADLGDKVRFHNFSFSTTDAELASFVRRNCTKNPNLYWEVTAEVLAPKAEAEVPTANVVLPKKKPGRPKVLAVAGMRTNSTE